MGFVIMSCARACILTMIINIQFAILADCTSIIMGWLRSVGSIKLYVSFAEYRLFYRALLQKRPNI